MGIKEAFEGAGVKTSAEKLNVVARAALNKNPTSLEGARDFVLAAARNDAGLLWELFAAYRLRAAQDLLSSVRVQMQTEEREGAVKAAPAQPANIRMPPRDESAGNGGAGGQKNDAGNAGQVRFAPSVKPASNGGGGGHFVAAGQAGQKPAAPANNFNRFGMEPKNPPRLDANARKVAAMPTLSKICTAGLLGSFLVNNRPIGEVTPVEANLWAASRQRDAKYVLLLTENLPPNEPIGKWRTAEEAANLYARAEESKNAA
jgi:hypothetical protein